MDLIERQKAIDALANTKDLVDVTWTDENDNVIDSIEEKRNIIANWLEKVPSVQQERDIPIKPIETTDTAWGIPHRQAVCPKCDYYLGHVVFLGDGKGRKVTYCETCGQAIDWSEDEV